MRLATFIGALGTCIAFAVPLVLALVVQAEHSRESLAYRYFASARILGGFFEGVFLLQGYLLSCLHHVNYVVIDYVLGIPFDDYRTRFNYFGYMSNSLVVAINAVAVFVSFRNPLFTASDKAVVALVSLVPVLATGPSAGMYYAHIPDYYHLNMVIITAATALFIFNLRSLQEPLSPRELVLLGAFVGVAVANKITMLPIAAAAMLPLIHRIRRPLDWKLPASIAIIAAVAVATFLFVMWTFFRFRRKLVVNALALIRTHSTDPNRQADYIASATTFLSHPYYAIAAAIFVVVALVVCWVTYKNTGRKQPTVAVLLGILGVAGTYGWIVGQRPAGTTFFEATNVLIGLTGMLVAMTQSVKWRVTLLLNWFGIVFVVGATYIASGTDLQSLLRTKQVWEEGWRLFDKSQSYGKPVIVVVPNNEFLWGDPYEVFLKGLSNAPTWEITVGNYYLQRFRGPISYRTEQSAQSPSSPYPAGAVIVWFDPIGLDPLRGVYPALAAAAAIRQCEVTPVAMASVQVNICVPD